jgi:hypothetical protein
VAVSWTPAIGYNKFPVVGECTSCVNCKAASTVSLSGAYLELPDRSDFPRPFSIFVLAKEITFKKPTRCNRTFALPEARCHRSLMVDFYSPSLQRDFPHHLNDGKDVTSLH